MYRVYILKKTRYGSEVFTETRTNTPSSGAAKLAFWDLRNDAKYKDKPYLLLMTRDKKNLNGHWFNRKAGDPQFIQHIDDLTLE